MSDKLRDLYYCYECNIMVDDGHRCEQWSQTTKIPIKAIELILSSHQPEQETVATDKLFSGRVRMCEVDVSQNIRSITVTNEDGTFIPFATMDRVTVVPWILEHHSEPDKP